jgi:hypothetical protein
VSEEEKKDPGSEAEKKAAAEVKVAAPAKEEAEEKEEKPEEKPATDISGDAIFDTLWDRVVENWNDDKVHGAMIEYAVRGQMLPELAGRYKELTNDPDKKERAQKRLNGVVMAATEMLMAMKTPAKPPSNKMLNLVVLAIAVLMICYTAYRVIIARHQMNL